MGDPLGDDGTRVGELSFASVVSVLTAFRDVLKCVLCMKTTMRQARSELNTQSLCNQYFCIRYQE